MLDVTQALARNAQVQLIVATHSPLVMAAAEPRFEDKVDAWFDLDLLPAISSKVAEVQLTQRPFERLGDVPRWLVSEAFDLPSARSREAEDKTATAEALVQDRRETAAKAHQLTGELEGVLGGTDPFGSRWRIAGARRGRWEMPQSFAAVDAAAGSTNGKAS